MDFEDESAGSQTFSQMIGFATSGALVIENLPGRGSTAPEGEELSAQWLGTGIMDGNSTTGDVGAIGVTTPGYGFVLNSMDLWISADDGNGYAFGEVTFMGMPADGGEPVSFTTTVFPTGNTGDVYQTLGFAGSDLAGVTLTSLYFTLGDATHVMPGGDAMVGDPLNFIAVDNFVFEAVPLTLPSIKICTLYVIERPDGEDGRDTDADNISGDLCDRFEQQIPTFSDLLGVAEFAVYISNTGNELLEDFNLTLNGQVDVGLGLDLIAGNSVRLDGSNASELNIENPCDTAGEFTLNISVRAQGALSGMAVTDADPASIVCPTPLQSIQLTKQVSINGGRFRDAGNVDVASIASLGAEVSYRFIVENVSSVEHTNVNITDMTLGIDATAIPGGRLAANEQRIITANDPGFSALQPENRCNASGILLNQARVDASRGNTEVSDINAAYVICEDPQVELRKQVSLDGANYFEANTPEAADVPAGRVGSTNAIYRLIVTNSGSEALANVLVEDPSLGISASIEGLAVGETRVITDTVAGFDNLAQPLRCNGTSGIKANIATVSASGESTGTSVMTSDAAHVLCIEGAAIELLKQVSLDGTNFVDADTPSSAQTGSIGANATYRLILRNVGDEDLSNVTVNDAALDIVEESVPDLAVGEEVVIDAGSFGRFNQLLAINRCDSAGSKLNVASVAARGASTSEMVEDDDPAYVNCVTASACSLSIDKTCSVPESAACTDRIAAATFRYIGPSVMDADVSFRSGSNGRATYSSVDLVSGVTILTAAAENNFTVDGGARFGSRMRIFINGEREIIDTNCTDGSFRAGAAAPLSDSTTNPPSSEPGAPSPTWAVVSFRQRNGLFVEPPAQPPGQDSCILPGTGATVNYSFLITNTGAGNITELTVVDDRLGEIQNTVPPNALTPGNSLTLMQSVIESETTTNTVVATANDGACLANDSVTVTIADADGDGVGDDDDLCPLTTIPEGVPTVSLGSNRWTLQNPSGAFMQGAPGTGEAFNIHDTRGCSCEQIIENLGLGRAHMRRGCKTRTLDTWIDAAGGPTDPGSE
ncbi:MAG: hypothetical protein AAF515_12930 [Pseudomonadota bacterium]